MSYKAREWVKEGVYHITNRGNRRSDIFKDEEDFQYFINLICEGLEFFGDENIKLIAYCLMDNHVHLLMKFNNTSPGEFIGRITGLYTRYFNKKNNYVGHLFQGRYHLEEISNDAGILEVCRYIHMNPVRASMVDFPSEYKWSNYNQFIGEDEEVFTNSEIALKYFLHKYRFEMYKDYVERVVLKEKVEEL